MLDFIVGFTVSILSGLGVGGGGLLVIWLVLADSVGQLEAQGINLVYFLFSSGAAMLVHMIKRKLNFRLIAYLTAFGAVGAVLGSLTARSADPALIRKIFGWMLLVSGTVALVNVKK